ncbi:MAG: GGDEF domain-containing protein [Rubrivivax sp.]
MNEEVDPLAHARQRIVPRLSTWAGAMLLVSGLAGFWDRAWAAGALGALLGAALLGNAWALHRWGRPALPFWALAVLLVSGSFIALSLRGLNAVFWACPVLFVIVFTLPHRLAKTLAVVLATGLALGGAWLVSPSMGVRLFLMLLLIVGMFIAVLDCIGELQRALVQQASTDPLTGALNRRQLPAALDQVRGQAGQPHAVLAIDVDHFKRINDQHGHDVGDEVLRRLVAAVMARRRRADRLFRVGGEEFLLLLPGVEADDAWRLAEALRQRLAEAELLPGHPVTVSIGLAMLGDAASAQDWIRHADQALYRAKRDGRNRVVVATPPQEDNA